MTQNKSNFAPPEAMQKLEKLGIKIQTEFVWDLTESYAIARNNINPENIAEHLPAATLEELLSICPKFINAKQYDYDHSIILSMEFFNGEFGLGYQGVQFLYHKDPKQAVIQMIEWCVEQGYI